MRKMKCRFKSEDDSGTSFRVLGAEIPKNCRMGSRIRCLREIDTHQKKKKAACETAGRSGRPAAGSELHNIPAACRIHDARKQTEINYCFISAFNELR